MASQICLCMYITAWKVSVLRVFLVCIFPHSEWIQRFTVKPYAVKKRENMYQKSFQYGHFSRSVSRANIIDLWQRNVLSSNYTCRRIKIVIKKIIHISHLVVISQILNKLTGSFFEIWLVLKGHCTKNEKIFNGKHHFLCSGRGRFSRRV